MRPRVGRALLRSLCCAPTAAAFGFDAYRALLATNPLPTNVATAGVLATAGDAIAQSTSRKPYDARRAASFVAFDAAYRGGFQTAALPWIIAHCDGAALGAVAPAGVEPQLLAALECTAFNQFLVIPVIYYPLFFAITGRVQGLDRAASLKRARTSFVELCVRNWKFWIPANLAQFAALEPQYQVAYTCVMGLIWNVILSATAGDARTAPPRVPSAATLDDALEEADALGLDAVGRRASAVNRAARDEESAARESPGKSPSRGPRKKIVR